jgi:hypothetical protein
MRTTFPLLALAALLPAAALAQGRSKTKAAKPAEEAPAEAKAPLSADAVLAAADKDIAALERSVADFAACAESVDWMKKDLTAILLRQPPKGVVLPNMNQDLLVIKQNRLSALRSQCIAQMKELNTRFNSVALNLGYIEPASAAATAPRRTKLTGLLAKYNAAAAGMGFTAQSLSAPTKQPEFSGNKTGFSKF